MPAKGQTWKGPRCRRGRHDLPEGGKCPQCKREAYERSFSGYSRSAETRKGYKLKARFGITLQEYQAMWENQGAACAVCGLEEPDSYGRSYPVDHDHLTGEVRAILCFRCNAAIGGANEDSMHLRQLADYLDSF